MRADILVHLEKKNRKHNWTDLCEYTVAEPKSVREVVSVNIFAYKSSDWNILTGTSG